jgi:2-oxoisovalerate dehydrogenase E1 component alpha subunit
MGMRLEKSIQASSKLALLRDMYMHMLFARLVDEYAWEAAQRGCLGFVATCRGHEGAQVGSAVCIEIGRDFTLPYYRDLAVVLTIGMTVEEVFRTYLQTRQLPPSQVRTADFPALPQPVLHWGYHKHNLVTGPAPVATQIMHAAGIAFACRLRKSSSVTVAYCGDGATAEPDFLEGITFAAHHQLPAIFICEQDCPDRRISTLSTISLPAGLAHRCIDGSDVWVVYEAMQAAIQHARSGQGPTLLEVRVDRAVPGESLANDPLRRCEELLQAEHGWDENWGRELEMRLRKQVEQALADVLDNAE